MGRMMSGAWRGICRAAYWSGIGPAAAARRRRPGTWTILTYHRIAAPGEITSDRGVAGLLAMTGVG